MTTKRIGWIDNIKALAIFLVVLGHYIYKPQDQSAAQAYIYSFHMHLFFLVAGLLQTRGARAPLKTVIVKRIRTLAVPYLIFGLLGWGFALLRRQYGQTPDMSLGVWDGLLHILTFKANWFLCVLFVVSIAYHIVAPRINGWRSFLVLAVACTGVHYALATQLGDHLHVNLPRCFTAMVFFALGAVCRDWLVSDRPIELARRRPYVPIAIASANIGVFYLSYAVWRETAIDIDFSSNYFSFYALSLSGISLAYIICRGLPTNAVLRFIGANTILIYLLEAYPPALIRRFMLAAFGVDMNATMNPGYACLYAAMSIAVLTPIIVLINRYAGWTIGRKRRRSVTGDRAEGQGLRI